MIWLLKSASLYDSVDGGERDLLLPRVWTGGHQFRVVRTLGLSVLAEGVASCLAVSVYVCLVGDERVRYEQPSRAC